jgi:hypothetical protein
MWLTGHEQVDVRSPFRLAAATPCVAVLLALFVMLALTASSSRQLHETLHQDEDPGPHFCLVCSLAKGQVSVAAAVCVLPLVPRLSQLGIRRPIPAGAARFESRHFRPRPPPAS